MDAGGCESSARICQNFQHIFLVMVLLLPCLHSISCPLRRVLSNFYLLLNAFYFKRACHDVIVPSRSTYHHATDRSLRPSSIYVLTDFQNTCHMVSSREWGTAGQVFWYEEDFPLASHFPHLPFEDCPCSNCIFKKAKWTGSDEGRETVPLPVRVVPSAFIFKRKRALPDNGPFY